MSDKFCFYHGTHQENLPFILKDGYIDLSSNMIDKHDVRIDWGGDKYIYGNILFSSNGTKTSAFGCGMLINDCILKDQIVIFNSHWGQTPAMAENESNNSLYKIHKQVKKTTEQLDTFSIYLYPSDTKKLRNFKLNIMKTYINNIIENQIYSFMTHEILFTKPINVNKYVESIFLVGINESWKSKIYKKAMKIINKIKNKPHIEHYSIRNANKTIVEFFSKPTF